MRRSHAAVVAVLALVGVLTSACGATTTGDKGYVDGGGVINEVAAPDRTPVGALAGKTLTGGRFDLADHRGHIVVVNVWGSWCAECRAEAATLVAAARDLRPKGVVFVGINTRDPSRDNPLAYYRTYHVPYPSIYDPDGRTLLAFKGTITPSAVPSTIVVDAKGRVAASVLGSLTSQTTLEDLVHDAGART